jgi:WD40 repeat protein
VRGIVCLAFSPDGHRLAGSGIGNAPADRAGEVRIWEAATCRQFFCVSQRLNASSVAFSPNGEQIACGDIDTVRIWEAATGKEVHSFPEESVAVAAVAFSKDGQHLASAVGYLLSVRDTATGAIVWTVQGTPPVDLVYSPDGRWIALCDLDGSVMIREGANGKQAKILKGHVGSVRCVQFSPDGQLLASAGEDQTVRIWAVGSQKEVPSWRCDAAGPIQFSGDGRWLLYFHRDTPTVEIRATADWERLLCLSVPPGAGRDTAFGTDGRKVAVGDWRGRVHVWYVAGVGEPIALGGEVAPVTALAFSAEGSRLAWGDDEGSIRVWDFRRAGEVFYREGLMCLAKRTLPGLAEQFPLPTTSEEQGGRSGKMFAILFLLQQPSSPVEAEWGRLPNPGHSSAVTALQFSPDGQRIASVDLGGTVCVWDLETDRQLLAVKGQLHRNLAGLAFSQDGRRLAAIRHDHTVQVWEVSSGTLALSLKGHLGHVHTVRFSPDGQRLASGGVDGAVKLWEATLGREVYSFEGHTTAVQSLAFSPDGRRLHSASADGTVLTCAAEWQTDGPSVRPPGEEPAGTWN